MIDDETFSMALQKMKNDIELTMFDMYDKDSKYQYYISIYAKDKEGLMCSYLLLTILNIKTKYIGMIPICYKQCAFDCIEIHDIFGSIKDINNSNIEGISILECDFIGNGDFYVMITRESKSNQDNNTIMSYRSFRDYCE